MKLSTTFEPKEANELKLLLKQKKYKELIDKCDSLTNKLSNPELLIYLLKAIAYRETNSYEESHRVYLEGLKLFPNNEDLLNDLARLLILKKDYNKAGLILKKLISKNKNNQVAQQNLESLKRLLNQDQSKQKLIEKDHEVSRSLSPLKSAFNPSEVKASKENSKKVAQAKLEKKLNKVPTLPSLDKEVLAEEWISAGKDALRSRYPELTLKFCGFAIANNGSTCQTYSLAGDAYMSMKEFVFAHLCYLIAAEHGEIESSQQLNLLSLAAMIGDNNVLTARNNKFENKTGERLDTNKNVEKIMSSVNESSSIVFDAKKGLISENNLAKIK
tara:strand:- start:363 stop:1352 length:990 start_codon:yes stop_codon:yes gene_type:complete